MKGLHRMRRWPLAVLLAVSLTATVVAAPSAAPAPEPASTFAEWVGVWLARLVPGWAVAASERADQPPLPPSGEGVAFDDPASSESCDPTIPSTCPESWPDLDPDG